MPVFSAQTQAVGISIFPFPKLMDASPFWTLDLSHQPVFQPADVPFPSGRLAEQPEARVTHGGSRRPAPDGGVRSKFASKSTLARRVHGWRESLLRIYNPHVLMQGIWVTIASRASCSAQVPSHASCFCWRTAVGNTMRLPLSLNC